MHRNERLESRRRLVEQYWSWGVGQHRFASGKQTQTNCNDILSENVSLTSRANSEQRANEHDPYRLFRCYSTSSSCSSSTMYLPQCSKCQTIISANELVMRADDKYIYHIDCFTCCLCNVVLKPGDDYGLHGSLLFCRLHSEQTTNTTFSLCSPMKSASTNHVNMKKSRHNSNGSAGAQRKQRTKLNNLENNTNNLEMNGMG